jgi:hypothetical protein
MLHILERAHSTTVYDVERFLHVEVPMDRNAAPGLDLLGPHRKVVRSAGRPRHDEYVATVSEMYQVLTPGSIQYIAARRCVRST